MRDLAWALVLCAVFGSSCAGAKHKEAASGDPLDQAQEALASLREADARLAQELEPLQHRVESGEATEKLQLELIDLAERSGTIAEGAERSMVPIRAMKKPPQELPELEKEASALADTASGRALTAIELTDVVSTRTGGLGPAEGAEVALPPAPPPATQPELQAMLSRAAGLAADELGRGLADHKARKILVSPASVTFAEPRPPLPSDATTTASAVYGRQFSRSLAEALRKAGLDAAYTAQSAKELTAPSCESDRVLISGTVSVQGKDVVWSLDAMDLAGRKELAVSQGALPPPEER